MAGKGKEEVVDETDAERHHSRLMLSQYPLECALGDDRSPLGKLVISVLTNDNYAITHEELCRLPAVDANYFERYLQDPKPIRLFSHYPWAKTALSIYKSKEKGNNWMTPLSLEQAIDTVVAGLGTAAGEMVYADGPCNVKALSLDLKALRGRVVAVAVSEKVTEGIKHILAVCKEGIVETSELVLLETVSTGLESIYGGDIQRVTICDSQGVEMKFYVATNIRPRPPRAEKPAERKPYGRTPSDKPRTEHRPNKPATSRMSNSVSPELLASLRENASPYKEKAIHDYDNARRRRKKQGGKNRAAWHD